MKNLSSVIQNYKIIYPDFSDKKISGVAAVLKDEIKKSLGADIELRTDKLNKDEDPCEYEIVIGMTNRKESGETFDLIKTYTAAEMFSVRVVGKKILLVGLCDDDTVLAVRYFINNCVKKAYDGKILSLEKNSAFYKKSGKVLYYRDDYTAVVLEKTNSVREPHPSAPGRFSYGKILKLEHSGENNGMLLATNEVIYPAPWPVYRSFDDGNSWEMLPPIVNDIDNCCTGYQPSLYELPIDMGKYKKGTILFVACTYTSSETHMFLAHSTDLGLTWKGICNIADGFGYNQGGWSSDAVWEPALIFEKSTGRMYCFYSDELENGEGEEHIGGHNQRLVYRYSTDLENWSETYNASALGPLRPGMIAITEMGDAGYAFVGEMVGYQGNWSPIKKAKTLDSWDASDPGKKIADENGMGCGGAPGMTWTPDGGDCGTLLVVAHHNVNGRSNTLSNMFMSFDYGETFVSIENPIPVKPNAKTYNGYSCGFFTDKDGYVYYINSCDIYPYAGTEKLVMAKIKVY